MRQGKTMSEGNPPPPPPEVKGSISEQRPGKRLPFAKPSIIYPDKDTYDAAASSSVGKYMDVVHTKLNLGLKNFGPDYIAKEVEALSDEMKPGKSLEQSQDELLPYLLRMSEYVQTEEARKSIIGSTDKFVQKAAETIGIAAVAEGTDLLQNVGGKVVDALTGKGNKQDNADDNKPAPEQTTSGFSKEKRQTKEKDYSEMTYEELEKQFSIISEGKEKEKIQNEMEEIVREVRNYRVQGGERFVDRIRRRALEIVKGSVWDEVFDKLIDFGNNLESEIMSDPNASSRWAEIIRRSVHADAADLRLEGVDNKGKMAGGYDANWLQKNGFHPGELDDLERMVERGIFHFLPDASSSLVMDDAHRSAREAGSTDRSSGGSRTEQLLEQLVGYTEAQTGIQMQQVDLLRKGYKGFVQVERVRAALNPEQFDQTLPPWYEELPSDEQEIIRARLSMNYWAVIKKRSGMFSLKDWHEAAGITFEKRALDNMWNKMPGFRVAMATMVNDIFDKYVRDVNGNVVKDELGRPVLQNHFVIAGKPGEKSDKGYGIIQSPVEFTKYKDKLAKQIETLLSSQPGQKELLERQYRTPLGDLAYAAVAAVDNFLFAGGAYDSGDEKRKITPGSADIYSEQVRAFFMPGIKGKVGKWLGKRNDPAKNPGVTEEDFGGPLGEWIRDNAQKDRNGFKKRLEGNKIRFIPDRMFYSIFDHITFVGDDYKWKDRSFAEALLHERKEGYMGTDLVDFGDRNGIDIKHLLPDELLGYYADVRSSAVKFYTHLAGGDPKGRMARSDILTEIAKIRKDGLANNIYLDEQVVSAIYMMALSPNGLIFGTDQPILNIPEAIYDSTANSIFEDSRSLIGLKPGFKERFLRLIHANDTNGVVAVIRALVPLGDNPLVSERERIRREAAKNLQQNR